MLTIGKWQAGLVDLWKSKAQNKNISWAAVIYSLRQVILKRKLEHILWKHLKIYLIKEFLEKIIQTKDLK